MRVLLGILFCAQSVLAAEKGADALLNSVGGAPAVDSSAAGVSFVSSELNDPFLIQLFSHVQVERDLPFETRLWAQKILKKDYAGAAHLWTAVQKTLPAKFESTARAAFLYSLWKVGVPQTFFDEWVDALTRKSFLESPLSLALDQTIQPGFDKWLLETAPSITAAQQQVIQAVDLSRGSHFASLRAWAALRSGEAANAVLALLPADHFLKVPLANTVALAMAKKGDLRGAGAVLKQHLEPAIEARKDVKGLSEHYLQIARLLYQAGSLDGAADFYQRVPDKARDFLKAREELVWVWLRQGETAKVRGELKTLRGSVFADRFSPDVFVVRAISNLKLCYYSEVEKELNEFVSNNRVWANRIETALKSEDPPQEEPDFFSETAKRAVAARQAEAELLEALATQSITATLPAVGPQQHWEKARTKALVALETAKKQSAEEIRRLWKNRKVVLAEAIRKMQFVKVELFSQVRTLSRQAPASQAPSGAVSALERDTQERLKSETRVALKKASESEMVFPFDGVIWPDELFKLTSVAQSRCQEKVKQ
jgi:tetratricopeptide (TPR) repeat protein